jgi:hypothetical protein
MQNQLIWIRIPAAKSTPEKTEPPLNHRGTKMRENFVAAGQPFAMGRPHWVVGELRKHHPPRFRVIPIKQLAINPGCGPGQNRRQGLFTKIEIALLNKEIDLAIHI